MFVCVLYKLLNTTTFGKFKLHRISFLATKLILKKYGMKALVHYQNIPREHEVNGPTRLNF